jgi:hypothetical protein
MKRFSEDVETRASLIWPEVAMPFSMSLVIKLGVGFTLCLKTLENLGSEKHRGIAEDVRTFKEISCLH